MRALGLLCQYLVLIEREGGRTGGEKEVKRKERKRERKAKRREGWKMSLAQIILRAATQLASSFGHLTPSTECHAKLLSQPCLPRVVRADSPVTRLQLFAELEQQPNHPSS